MSCEELIFSHSFNYRFFSGFHKPIIQADVVYNGLLTTPFMLVDSGAHTTALPCEFGLELGIDFTDMKPLKGTTAAGPDTFEYYRIENVQIIIVKEELEVICPVHFSSQLDALGYGLLGREVVFEKLKIAFRERYTPGKIFFANDVA